MMVFFLDTADLDEIHFWAEQGWIDGVTTNPSLLAIQMKKTGESAQTILRNICKIVEGPVSAEVCSLDRAGMLKEGLALSVLAPNIVIKVPLTEDGLYVCRALREQNIRVNVTLCFSIAQAILAAKAGATFISPFVGRLEDYGGDGTRLISDIRFVYDRHSQVWETNILAASVRHRMHFESVAKAGADIVTMPSKVLREVFGHPLTDIGLQKFREDWGGANIFS